MRLPITKDEARAQYRNAAKQFKDPEEVLTPEEQNLIKEDEAAREELFQAKEAFEKAVGTSHQNSALNRLIKAEAMAPVWERLAQPAWDALSRTRGEFDNQKYRGTRNAAMRALGIHFSQDLLEGIDCASLLPDLQLAFALGTTNQVQEITWPAFLATVFPEPTKEGRKAMNLEAARRLDEYLADEVEVAS